MYMQNFRCHVTGTTSTKKVAAAKPAVLCADDPSKCTSGAKQMIVWNQQEGNNWEDTRGVSPGYNMKLGFAPGAQNDIFE
ncbi:hypothetical protein SLS62_010285 [Diatrype stigma]|uniref:Uncharacterized protein n=1 Tax=Diatrype stigma TaxID=117547 RepID=A0AAN9UCX8_9PEZI